MIASLGERWCSLACAALRSKPCCASQARRCSYTLRGSFADDGLLLGHTVMLSVTRLGKSPRQSCHRRQQLDSTHTHKTSCTHRMQHVPQTQ